MNSPILTGKKIEIQSPFNSDSPHIIESTPVQVATSSFSEMY